MSASLVGSEMCIRDRLTGACMRNAAQRALSQVFVVSYCVRRLIGVLAVVASGSVTEVGIVARPLHWFDQRFTALVNIARTEVRLATKLQPRADRKSHRAVDKLCWW
eukprot:7726557-Alexandrium_andersonii.AAC.1